MKNDSNNEYKNYFDKISPDNRLIEDTKKKMMEELNSTVYKEKHNIFVYRRIAAAAACFAIVGSAVVMVPKLKNAPVSNNNNSSVKIEQTDTSCSESVSESEKSSSASVESKIKESTYKKSSTELNITVTDTDLSKAVSVTDTPVNSGKKAVSSKETEKKDTSYNTIPKESDTVSVSEPPATENKPESKAPEETNIPDTEENEFHGAGGVDQKEDSKTPSGADVTEDSSTFSIQIGSENYTVNLISSAYFKNHILNDNEIIQSDYLRKSAGKEKIISTVESKTSKCGFNVKDSVPLDFIIKNDVNDLSFECTSSDLILEINPSNSSAGGEKFISFAVSGKGEVGNIMKPKGTLCAAELNGIDNSIFDQNGNEGVYIGFIPSTSSYCASFDLNGFKYRIMFNGYEFEDVIDYLQNLILSITK